MSSHGENVMRFGVVKIPSIIQRLPKSMPVESAEYLIIQPDIFSSDLVREVQQ